MTWFASSRETRCRNRQESPLQMEQLEGRTLLAGDLVLIDIFDGADSSGPKHITELNGEVYFAADDVGLGDELWKSDGTSAGTQLVKNINEIGSSDPENLVNVSGTLFFSANDGNGSELWKSNGISSGTVLVKDIDGVPGGSSLANLTNVNGTLFFTANDEVHGSELWKSDGTSAGTMLVKDLRPGAMDGFVGNLINFNGTLLFRAHDGDSGLELWRTDGTSAGTTLVKDMNPGLPGSLPDDLTIMNGTVFFEATDGVSGYELWATDGTSAGTFLVKNINPTGDSISFGGFQNVNGTLFFQANDGVHGSELWKSDGTSAGTVLVKDILSGSSSSFPSNIVNVNGTAFFQAEDLDNGAELWMTDGTSAGTQLVKDIFPGTGDGYPNHLTNMNGTLFFSARNAAVNSELWMSDGTSAGTQLVAEIREGIDGAFIFGLTNANGTLFFTADDGTHGNELFALDLIDETGFVVTGADAGTPGIVRVFDTLGNEAFSISPYTPAFTGGVRVATGDVNNDGILDIVTAAGPGGGPHIQVFDSQTGSLISGEVNNFYAYDPSFTGGVYVAVGDVNGDGFDDIITGAGATETSQAHVRVFSGLDGSIIREFYAYELSFHGGVRVAAGDVNNDGLAEVVTAPGAGRAPTVRAFDGNNTLGTPLEGPATNFDAYLSSITTGIFLDVGDVDNDGFDDIITAPDAGGGPHVKVFSSADGSILHEFYAYDPGFTGGVRVALDDLTLDGFADILTAPGPGGGPHVKAFNGIDLASLGEFYSGDPGNTSGLFIAGGVSLIPEDLMPMELSFPLAIEAKSQPFNPEELDDFELAPSFLKKKPWLDNIEEFYQSAEEIDKLFSGLGIE
ncbi:Hypothetical protein PBC10988_30940 [Planctomycetales bacterium 10988]|nr:Hypothetical protein PBC10988_30940 [Planctomycetales bacterium 10988]